MIALRTSGTPLPATHTFLCSDIRQIGPLDLSLGFNSFLAVSVEKDERKPQSPMLLMGTGLRFIDAVEYLAQILPDEHCDSLDQETLLIYRNDRLIASLRATPAGPEVELATTWGG